MPILLSVTASESTCILDKAQEGLVVEIRSRIVDPVEVSSLGVRDMNPKAINRKFMYQSILPRRHSHTPTEMLSNIFREER